MIVRVCLIQYEQNVEGLSCLLSAVMESLCHPSVRLSALMPINYKHDQHHIINSQYGCVEFHAIKIQQ